MKRGLMDREEGILGTVERWKRGLMDREKGILGTVER